MRRHLVLLAVLCLLVPAAIAKDASRQDSGGKIDSKNGKLVDSGTFAVFQNGRRMATETFSIRQFPAYNVTTSEVHAESSQAKGMLEEKSKLTLLPNGSLKHYEMEQTSPIHRTLTVVPSQNILLMHSDVNGKKKDYPFFLTPADFILDDYFFSSREVLLWRYMATSCKPLPEGEGCTLIRRRYPVLIPQRRTSSEVYIRFKGYDDMPLNGRPQHLRHFEMNPDGPVWNLWLNTEEKLMRISIPAENVEVLRQ